MHFGSSILGPPAGAKQELPVYRERGEEGGEAKRFRENLKNDCILDFLFWDHLLEPNRSYQYIERDERRGEKQRYSEET